MSRLKKSLGINTDSVRIREFELGGQKFRVRVPLSSEAESMFEKTKEPPKDIVDAKFKEISEPLYQNKDSLNTEEFVFLDDDIVIKDKSMREMAKNKATTEMRILETFKLLVPADGTNFDNLTYEEITEEFPLPIQLTIVKKITEVISPGYEETRKN